MQAKTYLTRRQVSELYPMLGYSYLAKLAMSGDGPSYIKCRGKVFYEIGMIETWLKSHERRSTAEIPAAA